MARLILYIIIPILLLMAPFSIYTVNQWEKAILFQTGKIQNDQVQPGLHFKIPVFQYVYTFDGRILSLDSAPERFLTSEKKNVIVDSFVKWRIHDLSKYYTSVAGKQEEAIKRLDQIIKDGIRSEFGNHTVKEVVSGKKAPFNPDDLEIDNDNMTIDEKALTAKSKAKTKDNALTNKEQPETNIRIAIMQRLTEHANAQAQKELGIEVVDVRIKRVDLPEEVSDSVYRRMKAERERDARDFRARGAEVAEQIRADADKQSTIIRANAYREAEKTRGKGDAKATEIYAKAYSKDAEFYALYRSLNAYETAFSKDNDVMLLQPDSQFFRFFKQLKPTVKSTVQPIVEPLPMPHPPTGQD